MRLTDTIAGEEVHFEPCGPGYVVSIEIGSGKHYEFECTEHDIRIIADKAAELVRQLDGAAPECEGSAMPARVPVSRAALRSAAGLPADEFPEHQPRDHAVPCRSCGPKGASIWATDALCDRHRREQAEASLDAETGGAA